MISGHKYRPRQLYDSIYNKETNTYSHVKRTEARCGFVTYYDHNATAIDGTTHCDRPESEHIK